MNRILLFVLTTLFLRVSHSQSTTITPGTTLPVISSTTISNGIQLPKLSPQNILSIVNPQCGVMVFDTVCKCPRFFDGKTWKSYDSSFLPLDPSLSAFNTYFSSLGAFGNTIKSDNNNNIIVGGGKIRLSSFMAVIDLNIEKFSSSGVSLFSKSITSSGSNVSCDDLEIDASNNIYITGTFQGTMSIDGVSTVSSPSNSVNAFVAKLSPTGTAIWVKKIESVFVGGAERQKITLDQNGSIFVAGRFKNNLTIGSSTITANTNDVYLTKLDNSGNLVWLNQLGGAGNQEIGGIDTDISGNIFISGGFNTEITSSTTTLTSSGGSDAFIAKYNTSGVLSWIQKLGGTGEEYSKDLMIDINNNPTMVGSFTNIISFNSQNLTSSGDTDIFIAKYYTSGSTNWVKQLGNVKGDNAQSVFVDSNNSIYVSGDVFFVNNLGMNTSKMQYAKFNNNGDLLDIILTSYLDGLLSTDLTKNANGVFTLAANNSGTYIFGNSTISSGTARPFVMRKIE